MTNWFTDKISGLTTSAKVSLGMKTLGLTSEETSAADRLIGAFGGHPLAVLVTGDEVTSLKGLISKGIDFYQSSEKVSIPGLPFIAAKLEQLPVRDGIADYVMKYVASSPDRDHLVTMLEKVRQLPIPGFADHAYTDYKDFVSRGLLGYLSHAVSGSVSSEPSGPEVHSCPLCQGVYFK